MAENQQQQWATVLKKSQQLSSSGQKIPFAMQKKNIAEAIEYNKDLLRFAMQQKNKKKIEEYVNKLLDLRARQTALQIKEKREEGTLTEILIKRYTRSYVRDCARLLRATQT